MSDPMDPLEMLRRIEAKNPTVSILTRAIIKRFRENMKEFGHDTMSDNATYREAPIRFIVSRYKGKDAKLTLDSYGLLFIAAVADTLQDFILQITTEENREELNKHMQHFANTMTEAITPVNRLKASTNRCPKCSLINDNTSSFCKNCGTKLA
jgi:hypothetical protein